jgi:hypothetical protein
MLGSASLRFDYPQENYVFTAVAEEVRSQNLKRRFQ